MSTEFTIKEFNKKIYVFDEYMKLSDNQKDLKDTICESIIRYARRHSYLSVPDRVINYYNENIKQN